MRKESRNPITEAVNYGRPAEPEAAAAAEGGKEEVESDSGKKATKLFYGKQRSSLVWLSFLGPPNLPQEGKIRFVGK